MAKKNSTARVNPNFKIDVKGLLVGAESNKSKPLTTEETFGAVITAIRQHEPEHQNTIIINLINELAIDRLNKVTALTDDKIRAENNLNVFLKGTLSVEGALKEYDSKRSQPK